MRMRKFWRLVPLVVTVAIGCRHSEPKEVQVDVQQVGFDPSSHSPVVVLHDAARNRSLPIWIGPLEAQAIAMQLEGVHPSRPQTHDLVKSMLDESGVELQKVLIVELKDNTYFARIYLDAGRHAFEVDSRPSDAIALAVRFDKPIFVTTSLFQAAPAAASAQGYPGGDGGSTTVAGVTVQQLTADLAEYFGLKPGQGVLVSDASGASGLRRGDVVLELDGHEVRGVQDFSRRLRDFAAAKNVHIALQREAERLEVDMPIPRS